MGHTYSNILIHAVFSTKDRRPTVREEFRDRLYKYLHGIARQEFGKALKVGGTADHVHGLLSLSTAVSVAEAMRKWKSLSSGWVHKTFASEAGFGWQVGYGAFSVSQSRAAEVIAYIERQQEYRRTQTFQEEFIAFLESHEAVHGPAPVATGRPSSAFPATSAV